MSLNWMNGICMLVGLGLGLEIMWCALKYSSKGVDDHRDEYLRPCEADGDKAYFHRWVKHERRAYALIEYLDGTMAQVAPECIRFTEF